MIARFPIPAGSFSCLILGALSGLLQASPTLKFAFQPGHSGAECIQITGNTNFTRDLGYGVELDGAKDQKAAHSIDFLKFSVLLDEGNYDLKVSFGRTDTATDTTLKTENRRVMLAQIEADRGQNVFQSFTVNIRTPALREGGQVKINGRESGPPLIARWDDKLTLELLGSNGSLQTLEINRNDAAVTVFLAGDSTVTEQLAEPYTGWGQMLPLFFSLGTAISNHAESGLALDSFRSQKRLEKILQTLKPGDYVFIQFGHNDQKERTSGSGPFSTYKERLRDYVRDVLAKKGNPIVVTPMERRRFKHGKTYTTLHDFAEAGRQVAQEERVPIIDLHAMSLELYEALGEEKSRLAFVHYPPGTFPGQDKKLEDDTHHSAYGALQLAKCVVDGIRKNVPDLAARLRQKIPIYNRRHPDSPEHFGIPASPVQRAVKPAGN